MPSITDTPSQKIQDDLEKLREALDAAIPAKRIDQNLLIGTWNLRAFGGLTEKWNAGTNDSPKRDLASLLAIAEIVSRFDVVAVQEVRGNIKALRHLMKALDPRWSFLLTDVTKGNDPNPERLAFLFDTRRVSLSGLACELVLPPQWHDTAIGPAADVEQFARTPYAVSFLTAGASVKQTFILVTLHVLFGDKAADRIGELGAIAQWLADWAKDVNSFDQNLICLGDFNIDRKDDPNYEAFVSTGLRTPPELDGLPRTIFGGDSKKKFFDQLAWFTGDNDEPALSLGYSGHAGNFDFPAVWATDLTREQLSFKVSDHYPLWAEFNL